MRPRRPSIAGIRWNLPKAPRQKRGPMKRVLVAQSCPDPMDCSPPGSSVHGTAQARTLEWVAVPISRGSS